MKISYSAVWDDTLRLLRENGGLMAAVAGVFLFLPALLIAQFVPPPETTDPNRMFRDLLEYYREALPWLALSGLVAMVGGAAILRLALVAGTSVASAIVFGAMLLPFYFLLSFLSALIFAAGLILLIVPGLYLIGRLAPAAPIIVAENRRNPIAVIGRAFEITRGQGWAVFGLILMVAIVGMIATGVAAMLFGTLFLLAAGQDIGRLLVAVVESGLNAAFTTILLTLYAAIYRALVPQQSAARVFE